MASAPSSNLSTSSRPGGSDACLKSPLLPLLLSCVAGCIGALVIGLTPDDKWDARFNHAAGTRSRSNWVLAVLLVATLLVGAIVLIGTIARLFDLAFTGGAYG